MDLLVLDKKRIALVVAVVAAVVTMLNLFEVIHWSAAENLVVSSEASSLLILIMAITQHFRPGTAEEPVAIATSFYTSVATTISLFVAFQIVHWTDEQIAATLSVVTVVLALVGGWAARRDVTANQTPPDA